MPEFAGPMLRRRELGTALRRIRDERGMTIAEVTAAMQERYGSSFSVAKLSRMETARRAVIPRDVHDLCLIYEVTEAERERLVELAVEAHKGELSLRSNQERDYLWFVALERIASGIREYTAMFIPGLLQTPGYARVVEDLQSVAPEYYSPYIELAEVPRNADDRVNLRLERQALLDSEDAPHLHVLIDENALNRRLPNPEVMREQIRHLIEMSLRPNILIQLIPLDVGLYPGSETSYWSILDFAESTEGPSTTIFLESPIGGKIVERDADVSRMIGAFEVLSRLALNPAETRKIFEDSLARTT